MDDPDKDQAFKNFLVAYALDIAVMMLAAFWHVFFIIMMGLTTSAWLFNKINTWNKDLATNEVISVNDGWKLLLFGIIMGATDYLAGLALSVNKESILKMVGFTATLDTETSAHMTTVVGGTTTVITISEEEERKKNWFDLYEVMENWNLLFLSQRALQIGLPYAYLGMIEASVVLVFLMNFVFFNPTKA